MSEWLTTGQMVDKLEAGMNAISNCGEMKVEHEDSRLQFYNTRTGSEYAYFHAGIQKSKWRILPKYVSFEEAMRAYEKGYDLIFHDGDGKAFPLNNHEVNMVRLEKTPIGVFSLKSLYKGKWTIEGDPND